MLRFRSPATALLVVSLVAAACSSAGGTNAADDGSTGGTSAAGAGGSDAAGAGGTSAAGSSAAGSSTGGSSAATAGSNAAGGSAATGGTSAAAGSSGASGSAGKAGGSSGASGTGAGGSVSPNSTNPTCSPGVMPGPAASTPTLAFAQGVSQDAATKFGGSDDPSLAPDVVYPNDGTIVPPNLGSIDVQFHVVQGTSLFEVRFANQAVDFRYYATCTSVGSGCSIAIDPTSWTMLAVAARGTGPMTMTVRAVDGSNPGNVGTSMPRVFEIAPDPVLGGIYYWNAGASEIERYDFGSTQAEKFYSTNDAGSVCVGCHALSPKGTYMAAGLNAPIFPVPLGVIDVATKKTLWKLPNAAVNGSSYEAFSPDETEMIASVGTKPLILLDAMTGMAKDPAIPAQQGLMTMPAYLPDGSGIVYVNGQCTGGIACELSVTSGSLIYLSRDANGWGTPYTLASGMDNYYPSVSPDSKWVIFDHSTDNQTSDEAPDAQVWAVPIDTTKQPAPIQLTRANTGGVSNSWPKFAPFIGCNKHLVWFTFSSNRDYGVRIMNSQMSSMNQIWQLWMGAFNYDAAMKGEDPSFSVFWLPFQDPTTGNHIAQWTEKIVRQPCQMDSDCSTTTISGQKLVCKDMFCSPPLTAVACRRDPA